jgi:hypothetical protein
MIYRRSEFCRKAIFWFDKDWDLCKVLSIQFFKIGILILVVFSSSNSLVFNMAPSGMNLQQGSKGEKHTSFARAPNVYGL